jgi:hypothetical protein
LFCLRGCSVPQVAQCLQGRKGAAGRRLG